MPDNQGRRASLGLATPTDFEAAWGPVFRDWGTAAGAAAMVRIIAPSMAGDRDYLAWFAQQQRHALSRDAVAKFMMTIAQYDMDQFFPAVQVPALVLHRADDTAVPFSSARRFTSLIPGARLLELPGSDHLPYIGDPDAVIEATRQFLAGQAEPVPAGRQLVTLLGTDAADPESQALVRRHVRRLEGTEVPGQAGGTLARFSTATSAIRCALGIIDAAGRQGGGLRAGGPRVRDPVHRRTTGPTARPALGVPGLYCRRSVSGPGRPTADADGRQRPGLRVPPRRGVLDSRLRRPGRDTAGRQGNARNPSAAGRRGPGTSRARPVLRSPGPEPRTRSGGRRGATTESGAAAVIDDVARNQYRRRLTELDQEISEAAGLGDLAAAAKARHERDQLIGHLIRPTA